jgi:hypothetical protein
LLIVIIELMLSVSLCPKVITISGFHCNRNKPCIYLKYIYYTRMAAHCKYRNGHITYFILHITYYILHITYYILHITYYILHITYYILHITYYILQANCCAWHCPGFLVCQTYKPNLTWPNLT